LKFSGIYAKLERTQPSGSVLGDLILAAKKIITRLKVNNSYMKNPGSYSKTQLNGRN
jgi:hypothetical protein